MGILKAMHLHPASIQIMNPDDGIRSICLVSGGMDSCVAAALALREGPAAFLHIHYGQRTWEKEWWACRQQADHFGITLCKGVSFAFLKEIGGSALTDPAIPIPEADLHRKEIPASYVPFRNAVFLSMAVAWAEVLGAKQIYIGAVEQDSSGYPDCRQSFYAVFNRMIIEGTRPASGIQVLTPLITMRKSEIICLGHKLGAPFQFTWSCYQENEKACGRCDSCILRKKAFAQAGFLDPIPYAES